MKPVTFLCLFLLFSTSHSVAEESLSYAALLEQASQAIYSEDYDTATAHFREAYKKGSTDTEQALALAKYAHMLAYKQKDYVEAMKQVENGLKFKDIQPVAEVTLLQVKAKCLMQEDKFAEALTVTQKAVELKGVDWAMPPLYLSLGDCYRFTDDPEKAIESYQAVVGLTDVSKSVLAVAYLNKGMTYHDNLRNAEEARKAYQKAVEYNPDFDSVVSEHLNTLK
jgi:tetratricopeptide (TPR) repeat protein